MKFFSFISFPFLLSCIKSFKLLFTQPGGSQPAHGVSLESFSSSLLSPAPAPHGEGCIDIDPGAARLDPAWLAPWTRLKFATKFWDQEVGLIKIPDKGIGFQGLPIFSRFSIWLLRSALISSLMPTNKLTHSLPPTLPLYSLKKNTHLAQITLRSRRFCLSMATLGLILCL